MKSSQMDSQISIRKSTFVWGDSLLIFVVGRFVHYHKISKLGFHLMPFQLFDEQKTFANFLGKFHHMPEKLLDFVHL